MTPKYDMTPMRASHECTPRKLSSNQKPNPTHTGRPDNTTVSQVRHVSLTMRFKRITTTPVNRRSYATIAKILVHKYEVHQHQ